MFYFVTYLYEGNISVFENEQVGELKGNKPAPEKKKKNQKKLYGMRYTLCQEYQFVPSVFQNEVQFVPGVSQKKE